MGRGLLLWLIGIPIPIILLIWPARLGGAAEQLQSEESLRQKFQRRESLILSFSVPLKRPRRCVSIRPGLG
jgi:hypothetical protein